jgi:hypothetical protein
MYPVLLIFYPLRIWIKSKFGGLFCTDFHIYPLMSPLSSKHRPLSGRYPFIGASSVTRRNHGSTGLPPPDFLQPEDHSDHYLPTLTPTTATGSIILMIASGGNQLGCSFHNPLSDSIMPQFRLPFDASFLISSVPQFPFLAIDGPIRSRISDQKYRVSTAWAHF